MSQEQAPSIRVADVSKIFRVPVDRPATLKHRITHPRSTSRHRPFHALDGISFEVPPGEFLGIIGHNGSGKSTLLKIMAGIYTADTGTVTMSGRVSPFLELGVGFNPELTARENVFLSGSVIGLTRSELERKIESIIAFSQIGEFAETKLKNFSSGMQVRLAFSVAIQADADILLMDEVLAVGDVSFQEKCFEVFDEYKRQGRTVVLVTHDLVAVHRHCDRVLMLDHGRLVADGSARDVTTQYRRAMGVFVEDDDGGPASTSGALLNAQDRHGSRELTVTGVRLLDDAGLPLQTVHTDDPVTVEVTYRVNQEVDGFLCRVILDRDDGLPLAWPSSGTDGTVLPCPPVGSGAIVHYRIPRFPYCEQRITVGVDLLDRGGGLFYDHVGRVVSATVVDNRARLGITDPAGAWDHTSLIETATELATRRL